MTVSPFSLDTDEGLPIRGDLHSPAARGPVVVCIHGFKGFKDWGFWPETARRLGAAGYGVVRFNFSHSGVGEDQETFSEPALFESGTYSREIADLRAVLSRLERGLLPGGERIDISRVGLLGHSRGGVASLAVAASAEFPVRSVVLWNPVARVLWWDAEARRQWREKGHWEVVNARTRQVFRVTTALLKDAEENRERLEPLINAASLAVPLLVIVAREDESVPPETGVRLSRAAPAPLSGLVEIPATGHTFGATHPFTGSTPALEQAIGSTIQHFDRTLNAG
jgi:pimeloyl-ACP methyl ester carboxylesterase